MKIFYDENMPYAAEFFAEFGELFPFNGRKLTAEQVKDADVLLVRSITKVNQNLLKYNSTLKFVGTATIGVDHIDQEYLKQRDIAFTSAPGCNAISVAEYVISALVTLAERYLLSLSDMTVGIVGAGNTGSRLSEKLDALGINYCLCDPFLAEAGDSRDFVSLAEALSCDVVSLHVPLTLAGKHPTYHLLDDKKLSQLTEQQILINACRGEVIDNQALLAMKQQGHPVKLVLDVWEREPDVLQPLIEHVEIASAHIAGYSLEGKARGTEMLYQALCQLIAVPVSKVLSTFLPSSAINNVEINHLVQIEGFDPILLNQLVKLVYDVRRDDALFRQQIKVHGFDHIRKTYPIRREFSALKLSGTQQSHLSSLLKLGFSQ